MFIICLFILLIRFDCGSGTGKVRSDTEIILNQWNTLTVYRYRWDAWIQLNNGQRVQGRSKVNLILRFIQASEFISIKSISK